MNLTLTNLHPSLRLPPAKWRRVIQSIHRRALRRHGRRLDVRDLGVVWLNDSQMAKANWYFLRHKGSTDILTFEYGEGRAEILISLDTAKKQAACFHQDFGRELTLYLVHGMLHLAGLNDKTASQRLKMRKAEQDLLPGLKA